jgi:hypothetical protein
MHAPKLPKCQPVALAVSGDLLNPIIESRLGNVSGFTFMTMPKAAVHKDDLSL